MPELQILIRPDPESIRFEEQRTPMLIYTDNHPEHGSGWVLLSLDESEGIRPHYIPGGVDDVERAEESARDLLR